MPFARTYVVCFVVAGLASLVLTPLVMRLAFRFQVLDHPGHRKIHDRPTPLLGGLALAVATWLPIAALLVLYENRISLELREHLTLLALTFVSGVCMLALGIVDDRQGLNAKWKFMIQLPLAMVLISAGVHFNSVSIPFGGSFELGWFGPVITAMWLVGITNALNLIDGVDGLAAGVALFVALTNGVIASLHGNAFMAVLMFSLAGACAGFLRYNSSPARVFLGDSGSLFLGITLAVSAAMSVQKATVAVSMLVPVLVLGYPIVDTLLAMARRLWHGKSMFSGDSSHLHHRLLARGLGHRGTALVLYAVTALFCVLALATVMKRDTVVAVGLLVLGLLAFAGLRALGYLDAFQNPASRERRRQFQVAYHFANYLEARIGLAANRDEIFSLFCECCRQYQKIGIEISLGNNGSPGYWRRLYRNPDFTNHDHGHAGSDMDRVEVQICPFRETGLTIRVLYEREGEQDDLRLEKRQLLSDLAGMANRRLIELKTNQNTASAKRPAGDGSRGTEAGKLGAGSDRLISRCFVSRPDSG